MPEIAAKLTCNICGQTFDERKGYPGLKCCEMCDATGRSGILYRGTAQVFAGAKRGR